MKEIFSAFGSEVFRPLATIVIPGAMAISTWFVVLLQRFPSFRNLAEANHTETALLLALATPSSKPSKQELSAEGIRKAVTRFIERQSEFAQDFLTKDTSEIEKESRVWIREWHAGERRLRRRKRISPFRQPQSKEAQQGGASVDGGQVGAKEGKE
jgi:hypothetical protein